MHFQLGIIQSRDEYDVIHAILLAMSYDTPD